MDFYQLNSQQIPDDYCVIRVENSYKYLHFENGLFFFKDRLHGCFVTSKEIATEVISQIDKYSNGKYIMDIMIF